MGELYALPAGWEWKKIDDIVIKTGNITPKNNPQTKFTYIDISSIDNNTFSIVSPKRILGNDAPSRAKREVQVNDILFATTRPNLKNVAIIKENYSNPVASTGFCILRSKGIEYKYLFFYLLSNIFYKQVDKHVRGAQYPAISDRDVKSITIPLPPLQEQKRIVTKLDSLFDRIDRAIALHQRNIDEAEAMMGAVLNEVFGELDGRYKKRTLSSFQSKISAGGTPLRKEPSYWNGDIDWYTSGELNQLYTLPSKEKITKAGLENSSAKLFPKGTLLIGMYDTAAMKMSILSNDGSFNQAIVGFRPKKDELNIFFVKYQLEYLKEKILEQRQGVRQQNLNLSKIKNIKIEYPPLEIQQKTVRYLDRLSQKIEALKEVQQQKMKHLKDLKASILDRAFRGEL